MAIKEVTFQDLVEMDDGKLALAINKALKRAAADCEDRPNVKRPRSISINLSIRPVPDDSGFASDCKYGFVISESLPKRASREFVFGLRKNGVMTFNPDSLNDHNQQTFEFEDKDE